MFPIIIIVHVQIFSEPSTVAHAEAAVLQRASSVEATAPRSSPTTAGVEWQPAQGGGQTRSSTMLTVVKLTTTVNLLQLYKINDKTTLYIHVSIYYLSSICLRP